jgi:2Fe-2S ferredoxin
MPTIFITDTTNKETGVEAQPGVSVMEIIRDAGFEDLLALCGGNCSCATCHVVVDPAWAEKTGRPSADEQDLLDGSALAEPTSRLSCQIAMTEALDGLKVRIVQEA